MCGLVGALSFRDSAYRIEAPYLERMRETMSHRGPDGSGTWVAPDARVGLAFRRLKILDLSPLADQPMANEDGTIRLVFNGEIYNHAEIRRDLAATGPHGGGTGPPGTGAVGPAFRGGGAEGLGP